MRPMMKSLEAAGRGSPVDKQSLEDVEEAWHEWEIHFLILTSLFLQVLLFLTAGAQRRTSSWFWRTVLWLAYLSADSVAVFVLGHLAVRARAPGHQLMAFWAPFVLVHLGGQDTITAFSRQDNELWKRHLLNLVTQVAVAAYVVAKASWPPDRRLKVAVAVVFLSGCLKYGERAYCLWYMSPDFINYRALDRRFWERRTAKSHDDTSSIDEAKRVMKRRLEKISEGIAEGRFDSFEVKLALDPMALDAPLSDRTAILAKDHLPGLLAEFLPPSGNNARRSQLLAYDYVAALLRYCCYDYLHTKAMLRLMRLESFRNFLRHLLGVEGDLNLWQRYMACCMWTLISICIPFMHVSSSLTALILFWTSTTAGKGSGGSATDITVSYILLLGAVALDVSSAIKLVFSIVKIPAPVLDFIWPHCVRKYVVWPHCIRKQWSEELAQYSMIQRHAIGEDTAGWTEHIRQKIRISCGAYRLLQFRFLEVTSTSVVIAKKKDYQSPMKLLILDNLLAAGARKECNIASSRGRLALDKFVYIYCGDSNHCTWTGKALEESIDSRCIDFPTSVCIWHLATDMCYFHDATDSSTTAAAGTSKNRDGDQSADRRLLQERKKMCRQLSSYIMYLVFQCRVMLTTDSKLLHDQTHEEIRKHMVKHIPRGRILGEKAAVKTLLSEGSKVQIDEEVEGKDAAAGNEDVPRPVLPRACKVAQELIAIRHETERWGLIADVWSQMLYYVAPRCGPTFHYEKLSTGGEFATHVLLLMRLLGQYLPSTPSV